MTRRGAGGGVQVEVSFPGHRTRTSNGRKRLVSFLTQVFMSRSKDLFVQVKSLLNDPGRILWCTHKPRSRSLCFSRGLFRATGVSVCPVAHGSFFDSLCLENVPLSPLFRRVWTLDPYRDVSRHSTRTPDRSVGEARQAKVRPEPLYNWVQKPRGVGPRVYIKRNGPIQNYKGRERWTLHSGRVR